MAMRKRTAELRWSLNKNIDCAVKDAPHNRGAKEMKSRCLISRIVVACFALVIGLQLGCASLDDGSASMANQPMATLNDSTDTRYRPGDRIEIQFTDTVGLPAAWQQTVREDGTITLPLNKTVRASDLRKGELEAAIRDVYVPEILRRLTVNVRSDRRFYFVSGEVKLPGEKEHTGQITAMRAIATAGDFTDFAKKTKIEVFRSNGEKIELNGKKALRDPSKDVPVYPGDRVHVYRRIF
jgi:protein involved in polysaccharide export with SLBB domain